MYGHHIIISSGLILAGQVCKQWRRIFENKWKNVCKCYLLSCQKVKDSWGWQPNERGYWYWLSSPLTTKWSERIIKKVSERQRGVVSRKG